MHLAPYDEHFSLLYAAQVFRINNRDGGISSSWPTRTCSLTFGQKDLNCSTFRIINEIELYKDIIITIYQFYKKNMEHQMNRLYVK